MSRIFYQRATLRYRSLIAVGFSGLLTSAILSTPLSIMAQSRTVLVPRTQASPVQNSTGASARSKAPDTAILPAGLPLRIELDRRYRMHRGARISGRLIDPVYSGDHIVLPANTVIDGTISSLVAIRGMNRTWALLDGDVTPMKQPVLAFAVLHFPEEQRLPLAADATERTAAVVKMGPAQSGHSLIGAVKHQIDAKVKSVDSIVQSPHKSDLALKFFYGQLPYHPQEIWAGTQFDAILVRPLTLPDPMAQHPLPVTPPQGQIPPGTLDVRLVTTISSAADSVGSPMAAVLTQPYFNATKTAVILPTGTRLIGVVTQAKPARSFSRNGILRFTFRQVELPGGALKNMHGQMTAVEGRSGQNVTVDSEGGAKANSPQGKFLAPVLLGVLASHSFDADQGAAEAGVYSNGFGLVARIIGFVAVTPEVSAGFGFYSLGKSITRRWIMPGQNVVFAKNTRMELAVEDR
ncbi:MAG TPA: hypothetical protein VN670_01090 [Acidobacteriaceae bacterium]|nr:hypothetical protein [Acidobacteriaceae bacterium]